MTGDDSSSSRGVKGMSRGEKCEVWRTSMPMIPIAHVQSNTMQVRLGVRNFANDSHEPHIQLSDQQSPFAITDDESSPL